MKFKSILSVGRVLKSFSISFGLLLIILLLLNKNIPNTTPLFWSFVILQNFFWMISLLPILAIFEGDLPWYDPLGILFIIMLLTYGLTLIGYLIDPKGFLNFVHYGSNVFFNLQDVLIYLNKANLLILLFSFTIVLLNHKLFEIKEKTIKRNERKAAVSTGLVLTVIGIIAFLIKLPDLQNELNYTLFSKNIIVDVEANSLLSILIKIGSYSLMMGVIPLFIREDVSKNKKSSFIKTSLLLIIIAFTVLPDIPYGGRILIIYPFIIGLFELGFYGFKPSKPAIFTTFTFVSLLLLGITILRTVDSYSDFNSFFVDFINKRSYQNYYLAKTYDFGPLLDLDRTSGFALILKFLKSKSYVLGETFVARFVNLLILFLNRIFGTSYNVELLEANKVINIWRFGNANINWNVPPSIPGEFYMQLGIVSFLPFSILFGLLCKYLRKNIYLSKSFLKSWFSMLILLEIIKFIPTQLSMLTIFLLIIIPIIFITYQLFRIIYN